MTKKDRKHILIDMGQFLRKKDERLIKILKARLIIAGDIYGVGINFFVYPIYIKMSVYILQDCIFFGQISWDEFGNILPAPGGWKIKKNSDSGSLQIIYYDLDQIDQVVQDFSIPTPPPA